MADTVAPIAPYPVTTSAATVYEVPAGSTFVMRSIHATNVSHATTEVYLSIGEDSVDSRWLSGLALDGGQAYSWSGFFPITSGTKIQAFADDDDRVVLFIGGVEIS